MKCPYCNTHISTVDEITESCRKCVGHPTFTNWARSEGSEIAFSVDFVIDLDWIEYYPNDYLAKVFINDTYIVHITLKNIYISPDNIEQIINKLKKIQVFS